MLFRKLFCGIDTIHISITRPRDSVSFIGEEASPTDKIFYEILNILFGSNYLVLGFSKRFVNNGSEYVQSNSKEVLIQLRSTHLMKYGNLKIKEIIEFLKKEGIYPKPKRSRKKGVINEKLITFYQITRIDFAVDFETKINIVKLISKNVGHNSFFSGIQKGYFFRVLHQNMRTTNSNRVHNIKELKIYNNGFELAIYNKKLEIIEQATPEKLQLYPDIYRNILTKKDNQIFRVELRLFRSRSIVFNEFDIEELFSIPPSELLKFGKATRLLKMKNDKIIESKLFNRIFR